jgi:cytochrome c-type biogenesis protein CcmH
MVQTTALLCLALLSKPIFADSYMAAAPLANVALTDPTKEAAAKDLMNDIRCVVCQGQSIADSGADLAGDMRAMIRERIQKGESPDSIRAWLIQRYGKWVSYDPPFTGLTAPLWALPLILLSIGGWLVAGRLRLRRKS